MKAGKNANRGFKLIQRINAKVFKRQDNKDMSFKIPVEQYNNPFTIIPEIVYEDFRRAAFKRHTLQFPLNVPVLYQRVRAPKDYVSSPPVLPRLPNYGHLTGNQLLLVLARLDELTPYEISEVFFNLARRPEAAALELHRNGLVAPAVERFLAEADRWTVELVTRMAVAFQELRFEDERIWNTVRRLFFAKIYAFERLSSRYFGQCFKLLWDHIGGLSEEERALLTDQLPRYLKKMPKPMIIEMFELCLKHDLLTSAKDYLFERHFFMFFWKGTSAFDIAGRGVASAAVPGVNNDAPRPVRAAR